MGWSHPDISLEDLMKLIQGFVDILILTSGYQSSGSLAHWDPININKAFQWALFFENVLGTLSCLDVYQDSLKELDEALSTLKSDARFPQGLAHVSCATLTTARKFVLEHFIHTLPLRDSHLRPFLMATIEMDLVELSGTEHNRLSGYLNKLKLQNTLNNSDQNRRFSNEDPVASPDISFVRKLGECNGDSLTKYTVQELLKRWSAVSHISTIEKGLKITSNSITSSSSSVFDDYFKEQVKQDNAPVIVDQLVCFLTWNHWKVKNLCYFLDKRSVRMVSGASMIFFAPKMQWVQVFKQLNISAKSSDNNLCDTIELLLLGCISGRWTKIIEHFLSVSYNSPTTSEQHNEVWKLLHGKCQIVESKEETTCLKEKDILEYLAGILGGQLHPLWNISPVLAAVAIPSWSPLFRFYLDELEIQFRGDFSTMRCCNCNQEKKEHNDCELAERIWCLYIFHVYSRQVHNPSSA
ncbi:hypothetical protein UlMin_031745 [Ulmus minor]